MLETVNPLIENTTVLKKQPVGLYSLLGWHQLDSVYLLLLSLQNTLKMARWLVM